MGLKNIRKKFNQHLKRNNKIYIGVHQNVMIFSFRQSGPFTALCVNIKMGFRSWHIAVVTLQIAIW